MSIEYIAKSARRVHAEHSQISKILKHLCSSYLLVAFYLFIHLLLLIIIIWLKKKLLNTEKDSKPSLYKTLMGDMISHLKKKSKEYFVCTMGLKAYSFVLTHKTVFRMVRL